ncbi:MAG: hypothetical protein ABI692_03435 [Terracoccus sp.]
MTLKTLHPASTAEANDLLEHDPLAQLLGLRLDGRRPHRGFSQHEPCA